MKTPIIALSVLGTASIITATPIPGSASNAGIKQRRNIDQVNTHSTDIAYTSSTSPTLSPPHPATLSTITSPTPTVIINTPPQPHTTTTTSTSANIITTPPSPSPGMVYAATATPVPEEPATAHSGNAWCDSGLSPTNSWAQSKKGGKTKRFLGFKEEGKEEEEEGGGSWVR